MVKQENEIYIISDKDGTKEKVCIYPNEKHETTRPASDFEEAISATSFGPFNLLLLACALPCSWTTVFDTSTVSYILPGASCDLNLTLVDKGWLNAITYIGMIASAFIWGFLADTLGRRKMLIYGYFLGALFDLLCGFSYTMWVLMFFKFMGGFVICGPFAVLMTYLSEFHSAKHRGRSIIYVGLFFSLGNIILPYLAWIIIPQDWTIILIEDTLVLHSWQIFMMICGIPSVLSGILICMFPESPKFLMSRGRNEEAMKVFKTVFRINTGLSGDQYPIDKLLNETAANDNEVQQKNSGFKALTSGLKQMKPLLLPPLVWQSILVYTIQFLALLGLNTMRLWMPQLFTILEEFSIYSNGTTDSTLCQMLESVVMREEIIVEQLNVTCTVTVEGDMYMNSIIVGVTSLLGYIFAVIFINAVGNKNILIYGFVFSGATGIALYWARDTLMTLILSSLYIAIAGICSNLLISVTVDLFPTSIRTMAISLLMMFGRVGAVIGNVMFPILLEMGCLPPFIMIGAVITICGLLCIALPKTSRKPLQ